MSKLELVARGMWNDIEQLRCGLCSFTALSESKMHQHLQWGHRIHKSIADAALAKEDEAPEDPAAEESKAPETPVVEEQEPGEEVEDGTDSPDLVGDSGVPASGDGNVELSGSERG